MERVEIGITNRGLTGKGSDDNDGFLGVHRLPSTPIFSREEVGIGRVLSQSMNHLEAEGL